jgi:hypothetical protein
MRVKARSGLLYPANASNGRFTDMCRIGVAKPTYGEQSLRTETLLSIGLSLGRIRIGQQVTVDRHANLPRKIDACLKNAAIGITPIQQSLFGGFVQAPVSGHLLKNLSGHSSVIGAPPIMFHVGDELAALALKSLHIDPKRHFR